MAKNNDELINTILNEILEIKETMARNTISLEIHMKRSDSLEKLVALTQQDMKSIKQHVAFVRGAAWALAAAGAVILGLNSLGILQKLL